MMSVKAFKDKHIAGVPVIKPLSHFIGEICFSTKSPGEGWVECNGENGTVDTRETRLFGTPNDASLGQRINDAVGRHRHTAYILSAALSTITNAGWAQSGDLKSYSVGTYPYCPVYLSTSGTTSSYWNVSTFSRSRTYYLKMWMYVGV